MNPLFLGLDLSTQQLKAVVIDGDSSVVATTAVNFGKDFPQFGTRDGVVVDGNAAWTPVGLWLSALDLLMEKLKGAVDVVRIAAVSGTAQQHGTVYWSARGEAALAAMDKDNNIHDNLKGGFAREKCPIWMDSSTEKYVERFNERLPELNRISGSKAYHRFSGPQIARIHDQEAEEYAATTRISLISSFVASLLSGVVVPIDSTDACGTNLLDLQDGDWSDDCLAVITGEDEEAREELKRKLGGKPVAAGTRLGPISRYFVDRFGMNAECSVVAFTGDNLSSMADLNVVEGDVVLSLGTSDTAIFVCGDYIPLSLGHLFIHPTAPRQFITLICYKNGSLTRERIRHSLGVDWEGLERLLSETKAGNDGNIGIFFDHSEIEPPVSRGDYRWKGDGERVSSFPLPIEARALLEGQILHLRVNCPSHINRVIVTGGASANRSIRQLIADIFGRPVFTAPVADSAAQGGAKRAKYVHDSPSIPYSEYFRTSLRLGAEPTEDNIPIYKELLLKYREREGSLLPPPQPLAN